MVGIARVHDALGNGPAATQQYKKVRVGVGVS